MKPNEDILKKKVYSNFHSALFDTGFVNLNEIYVSKSNIDVKENVIGIFDNYKSKVFLDLKTGLTNNKKLSKSDPLTKSIDELLWYTNFV